MVNVKLRCWQKKGNCAEMFLLADKRRMPSIFGPNIANLCKKSFNVAETLIKTDTMRLASIFLPILAFTALPFAGCMPGADEQADRPETSREFPRAFRPVSESAGTEFSTEAKRDEAGEAKQVMDWAGIRPGTTVADIGAGEGYYTVRLAERVGDKGRVLAQDINRGALERLGIRIDRENWKNVSIKPGEIDDPKLPEASFDRIFMVHMYHEITEPYAFLWRMRPALAKGGEVIVVDRDRPTSQHGIPPKLLFCEFEAVGYKLKGFSERPEVGGYFARFELAGDRPEPSEIKACSSPK